jgi:hypothetical protein
MKEKVINYTAHIVSELFSPMIVPTIGILLIMTYIPAVEYYPLKLKLILLAIVICSTCLIPLLYLFISKLNQRIFNEKKLDNSKILFYLFYCLSVFFGAQLLGRLPVSGLFKLFLLGTSFVMLMNFLITFKWDISEHISVIGGLWGTLIALNFRYGIDIVWVVILISIIAGIIGASRIYLEHHTPAQVYSGFAMGAMLMFGLLFII